MMHKILKGKFLLNEITEEMLDNAITKGWLTLEQKQDILDDYKKNVVKIVDLRTKKKKK